MVQQATLGTIATPIGVLGVAFSPVGLGYLSCAQQPLEPCERWLKRWYPDTPVVAASEQFDQLARQLDDYFAGRRQTFSVPLDLRGTPFQLQVWRTLQTISYGQVWTYRQLAQTIGRPQAARAVGSANARNPISILVPCHRLVGSDGTLHGYMGGITLKQRLLQLEGALDQQA